VQADFESVRDTPAAGFQETPAVVDRKTPPAAVVIHKVESCTYCGDSAREVALRSVIPELEAVQELPPLVETRTPEPNAVAKAVWSDL
jgi:hypothetical protein